VPEILAKIEDKKVEGADVDGGKLIKSPSMEDLTPSQRAAFRLENKLPVETATEKATEKAAEATSPSTDGAASPKKKILATGKGPELPAVSISAPIASADTKSVKPEVLDAKVKLQKVFGVPIPSDGISPFSKKPQVYDSSVYQKSKPKEAKYVGSPQEDLKRAEAVLSEIEQLRRDLENQAQWDGVRLQKAVYSQFLEDKKSAALEVAELAKKHTLALNKAKNESIEQYTKALENQEREMKEIFIRMRERDVSQLLEVREKELRLKLDEELMLRTKAMEEKHVQEINAAKAEVHELVRRFDELVEFNQASRDAASTAAAAFALCDAIKTNKPFAQELADIAGKTQVASIVAKSIPESAAENGISTLHQLQGTFTAVSRRGLDASLVPSEAAGTLWAHFLGVIMARLKISRYEASTIALEESMKNGISGFKCDEDRIRAAQKLVRGAELEKAVQVLDGVEAELPKEIIGDWLKEAKARCAADRAASVLFADASIAQIALATTPPKHPGAE